MRELPYGNDRLTSKSNAADTRKKQKGGIAQLARASALQAEGRRFDSDYLHKIKTSIRASFFVEISFDPQSLRDSPQGHTAVVFAAIGHLRPPFSMKTPFLRCAAAAAFAVLRASFFVEISFDPQSLCDSPQGHTAVVFDAIGHLRPPFSSRANHRACILALQWRRMAFLLLDEVEMAASSKLIGPTAPRNATCPAR